MATDKHTMNFRASHEAGALLLHLFLLTGITWGLYPLIGNSAWTQAALAGVVLAGPFRYAACRRLFAFRSGFSWTGWMAADLLFFGFMGWKFDLIGNGGALLAGLILIPASLLFSPFTVARYAVGIILLYAVLLFVEGPSLFQPDMWMSEIPLLGLFSIAALILSTSRMGFSDDRPIPDGSVTDLFEQLHLNLLLLDRKGRLLGANRFALEALGREPGDLTGLHYTAFLFTAEGEEGGDDTGARSGWVNHASGSRCPVVYQLVPSPLPWEAGVADHEAGEDRLNGSLLVFMDSTNLEKRQKILSRKKHSEAVNNMLEVFADGVRNPLAGISAYVQMQLREEEMKSGGGDPDQARNYQQMVNDIGDLDALLEGFLANTLLTPKEVEKQFAQLKARRQQGREHSSRKQVSSQDS